MTNNLRIENNYTNSIHVLINDDLQNDNILQIKLCRETVLKTIQVPKNFTRIVVGKQILENNKNYTTQYSTTQGLPAINIINHYDVPILVNTFIIEPHCNFRYTGTYNNGIPYGEILFSTYDENVIITEPVTDLHYGLILFQNDF